MSFEASAAAAAMPPEMLQPQTQQIDVAYNATLSQAVQFQNLLHVTPLSAPAAPAEPNGVMKTMMGALEQVNGQASDLAALAQAAEGKAGGMTPGEMVMMTVRAHEFMFNCQLTSNMANRTSDGLQQLFRQQS
ncbi:MULTISPECIES: hypothetical protein [Brevundimonas]|uniref:hypothetical protein n=1 Tax=Brevundimonas TaxID=41275 RepID=UPI001906CDB1|nr:MULTISPECIES: hypothetical protein [Brevundimonas]MDA0744797.1 hypothetical protein [Pseudomonadota bacterium]MBK1969664.1 hypothetical protein [Brevundimonas diminuta]MBK1977181.1 hypothetical protein [Brevundimonas diminuta]MDA1322399.1 hypothetical protein [Pseudomonadota bacterium]MDM8354525.1 hypothetical protein [Brevundimonas diminuta]